MYEGLQSAFGGVRYCVSCIEYFASTNGMMSAMCWHVAGATTTVITNCQARELGNLPKDDARVSHARILTSSVRVSTTWFVGSLWSSGVSA